MNGSSSVEIALRSNATFDIKNNDKYCFLWSILASLQPYDNDNPNGVSSYRQNFDGLNIDGFDFSNGFKCSDVHKFEKINNLSINIFELNFYKGKDKWKHNSIPIEISKNESDRVVVLIYKINMLSLKIKCIARRSY